MITERMTHIAKSVSNTSSDSEEVAKQIIKYIDQNFSNQLLGLLNLEDEFKIPKKKISVIIRNATGKKFTEYVEFKRVENAKKLLSTSKDDAVSISTACGFSNETSFYRSFKKLVGVTPASYRSIYFKK